MQGLNRCQASWRVSPGWLNVMLVMLAMLVRRISPGWLNVTAMASGRVNDKVLHQFNDLLNMSNPDRGAVWGLKRTGGREFQTCP